MSKTTEFGKERCPHCGGIGPHYVPPSCGENGFFACDSLNHSAESPIQPPVTDNIPPDQALKLMVEYDKALRTQIRDMARTIKVLRYRIGKFKSLQTAALAEIKVKVKR